MKKHFSILAVVFLVLFLLVGCAKTTEDEEVLIAHLPKSIGGAWFTRMYVGFERYAADHENVSVVQIGASEGDAALQNAAIEDFITQLNDELQADGDIERCLFPPPLE